MNWSFGDYILSVEYRTGIGLDFEFVDSRPVWTTSRTTMKVKAMCMSGVVLLVPLVIISLGQIYKFEED